MKLGQVFPCFCSGDFFFRFLDKDLLSFWGLRKNSFIGDSIISHFPEKWEVFITNFFNRQSCLDTIVSVCFSVGKYKCLFPFDTGRTPHHTQRHYQWLYQDRHRTNHRQRQVHRRQGNQGALYPGKEMPRPLECSAYRKCRFDRQCTLDCPGYTPIRRSPGAYNVCVDRNRCRFDNMSTTLKRPLPSTKRPCRTPGPGSP